MPTSKAISASSFFGKDRYEYYLNELLTEQTIGGQKLSKEQLKEGFSKRKNKISFEKFVDKVVTTKAAKASDSSPGKGPSPASGGRMNGPRGNALVRSPSSALQKYTGVSQKVGGGIEEDISAIAKYMSSIADTLSLQKKVDDDASAYDKRKAEQEKRKLAENKLEKRFEGLKKAAEKIIAPVKSILDKIFEFITTALLGRIVYKLIEWFGDPKNADKVKAITRFLGDHWPKLLALYLTFGTSFGRFALGLTRAVARGAVKLLAKIALLAAAKKMRGARGVAKFLGGGKGKLLTNVVGTGLALSGAYAVSQGFKGTDGERQQKPQGTQGFSGGGYVRPRFPAFSGGGFNFKGMMGGASMGAMFGPLGMLLGGALGSGKPQQMMSGFVSGESGVDKVPAMLSDGEFVMSRGAVQKYGVDTLESMNAAGGGTNQPKIINGKTHAEGGGYIGPQDDKKEKVKDSILEKRKQSQKALSSGKGVNLKGATSGMNLGTGYSVKYQGKNSIIIKDGGKNFSTGIGDSTINFGGIKYFAMKRGNDVIYVPQDSRDRGTGGLFQPGGMFGGPRNSARMDYAASKGKYYSSSDQKTYANYNDALAAKKSRMTKLASQQGLNKLSNEGKGKILSGSGRGAVRSKGKRFDAEAKAQMAEFKDRGGVLGQMNRGFTGFLDRLAGGKSRYEAADKASQARVKQAGAESIGRYYSSSDGKYYKDYAAAKKARDLRLAKQQKKSAPNITPSPKPKPKYTPAGGGMNGGRSSAGPTSQAKTPRFSANTKGSKTKANLIGVHR